MSGRDKHLNTLYYTLLSNMKNGDMKMITDEEIEEIELEDWDDEDDILEEF